MDWLRQRFELSRGGRDHNVRSMEGLRGLAVLLVFLVHYVSATLPLLRDHPLQRSLAMGLQAIGGSGVSLFFLLSGYLIYGGLMRGPQPFMQFIGRRIRRLYPAFMAVFLLYFALSQAFPAQSKIPGPLAEGAIYLLQNLLLLPGLFPIRPMITVAWTLSYEMSFYLTVPLLVSLLRLRQWSRRARGILFYLLAGAIAAGCAPHGGPVLLILFLAGMLLHEVMGHPAFPAPGDAMAVLALGAGFAAMLLPADGTGVEALQAALLFGAFFVFCLGAFRQPAGLPARTLAWTPLRWLGNMSYSYYLLHGLTLKGCFLLLAHYPPAAGTAPLWFWGTMPVAFGVTLLTSAGLFLLVERPFSLAPRRPEPDRQAVVLPSA